MLTSTKHIVTYCTPWQQMQSTKSTDLIGHIKFLPWGQLDGCSVTRPFLSLRRMWLARLGKDQVVRLVATRSLQWHYHHTICWNGIQLQYLDASPLPVSQPPRLLRHKLAYLGHISLSCVTRLSLKGRVWWTAQIRLVSTPTPDWGRR